VRVEKLRLVAANTIAGVSMKPIFSHLYRPIADLRVHAAFAVAVICGLIAGSFVLGINRGMHHKIGWGPLNDFWHLSVAISDNVYGLNHGYVGFGKVFRNLMNTYGIVDWTLDPKQIPRLEDQKLINLALAQAATIKGLHDIGVMFPPTLETYRQLDLMAPIGEDLGQSALYAMAFRIFGLKIESAYYLFYLLLSLSVAAYVVEFYKSTTAIAALLFNALAFHMFFHIQFFAPLLPTVYFNRFASALCIIPAFHFAFLLIERRKASRLAVAIAVAQLGILLFGAFVRSSGNWVVLGIVALFAMQLAMAIWRTHPQPWMLWLQEAGRTVRAWPVILLLGGVAALSIYVRTIPHPIFRTFDNAPHHMRWHNAWLGFSVHPDWTKYYPDQAGTADGNAFNKMTLDHLREAGLQKEFISPFTNQPRIGLHDAYIRVKYLEFARNHPTFVLQTWLYYKPLAFAALIKSLLSSIDRSAAIPLFAVLLAATALALGRGRRDVDRLRPAVGGAVVLFVFSLAPVIWAYPALHVMSDQIWTTTAVFAMVAWAAICAIANHLDAPKHRPIEVGRRFWQLH
jgi:hypothetical protein